MSQNEKKTVSVRVNMDLYKEIEKFKEERQVSESDALRALLREGIRGRELEDKLEIIESEVSQIEDLKRKVEYLEDDMSSSRDSVLKRLFGR